MTRTFAAVLLVALGTACGGGSTPTAPSPSTSGPRPPAAPDPASVPNPSPVPSPSTITVNGTITDTITGAPIGILREELARLPALLPVSLEGYVTRQAWIVSASPAVDLIPERGFDLAFYRQFARNAFEELDGGLQPLWVLPQAPSFYMEVEGAKGLAADIAARLEQIARRLVPELTGGKFQVTRWETGPTARPPEPGWIVIERMDNLGGAPSGHVVCGRVLVGALAGQVFLHGDQVCRLDAIFAHELGHALGFFHVDRRGALMYPIDPGDTSAADGPIDAERRPRQLPTPDRVAIATSTLIQHQAR